MCHRLWEGFRPFRWAFFENEKRTQNSGYLFFNFSLSYFGINLLPQPEAAVVVPLKHSLPKQQPKVSYKFPFVFRVCLFLAPFHTVKVLEVYVTKYYKNCRKVNLHKITHTLGVGPSGVEKQTFPTNFSRHFSSFSRVGQEAAQNLIYII